MKAISKRNAEGLMRKRSGGIYSLMTVFKTDSAGEICFSKAC